MQLVWDNCREYNEPDAPVVADAEAAEAYWRQCWAATGAAGAPGRAAGAAGRGARGHVPGHLLHHVDELCRPEAIRDRTQRALFLNFGLMTTIDRSVVLPLLCPPRPLQACT